jgi:hypothetical protein
VRLTGAGREGARLEGKTPGIRDGLVSVLAPTRSFLNTALGKEVWATLSLSLNSNYVAFVEEVGLLCGSYTGTSTHCELKETTASGAE